MDYIKALDVDEAFKASAILYGMRPEGLLRP